MITQQCMNRIQKDIRLIFDKLNNVERMMKDGLHKGAIKSSVAPTEATAKEQDEKPIDTTEQEAASGSIEASPSTQQ